MFSEGYQDKPTLDWIETDVQRLPMANHSYAPRCILIDKVFKDSEGVVHTLPEPIKKQFTRVTKGPYSFWIFDGIIDPPEFMDGDEEDNGS